MEYRGQISSIKGQMYKFRPFGLFSGTRPTKFRKSRTRRQQVPHASRSLPLRRCVRGLTPTALHASYHLTHRPSPVVGWGVGLHAQLKSCQRQHRTCTMPRCVIRDRSSLSVAPQLQQPRRDTSAHPSPNLLQQEALQITCTHLQPCALLSPPQRATHTRGGYVWL